jgi:ribonucleoside-diphosphate reductase alpha chain
MEVFINVGKPGADVYAMAEALGRTISMSLRFNIQLAPMERVRKIVDELEGIGGSRTLGFGKNSVKSLPDAVAKVLATHYSLHNAEVTMPTVNGNGTVARAPSAQPVAAAVSAIAAIQQVESHVLATTTVTSVLPKRKPSYDLCGKCGEASLVHEEGCKKCYSCGYSAC